MKDSYKLYWRMLPGHGRTEVEPVTIWYLVKYVLDPLPGQNTLLHFLDRL